MARKGAEVFVAALLQSHLEGGRLAGADQRRLLPGDLEVVLRMALVRELEDDDPVMCGLRREREVEVCGLHLHSRRRRRLRVCEGDRGRTESCDQRRQHKPGRKLQSQHVAPCKRVIAPRAYASAQATETRLTAI